MRILSIVVAAFMGAVALTSVNDSLAQASLMTVESLNQNKDSLSGKAISAKGKVVKVNNGIMGRNFVHVQDGTGDAKTNNLIVTSKQTANVGDQVTVSGTVMLNRDFGGGYSYPLLIEDASIAAAK